MSFTESLTVRILGDSSQLRSELNQVTSQLDGLQERVRSLTSAAAGLGPAFAKLSSATPPLQQLSQLLTQVTSQVRALSQQQVTLNVQPAMQALQGLIQLIEAMATRLRTLSALRFSGGGGALSGGSIPGYATGGLVTGPAGIDQVPAMLTAGEFVLSREATLALGTGFLNSLNQDRAPAVGRAVASPQTSTSSQIGEVHVHVQQPGDVTALVRDLRFQAVRARIRHG